MTRMSDAVSASTLDANKALVRRLLADYGAEDLAGLDAYVAPDYIHHFTGGPRDADLPGFKRMMAPFATAFPDAHLEVHTLVAEGHFVAARMTFVGTHRGALHDLPATGHVVCVPIFAVYRVADGRIAEAWQLTDNQSMSRQLAPVPAPA